MIRRHTLAGWAVALVMATAGASFGYVRGNYEYHFWHGVQHLVAHAGSRGQAEIQYGLRQLRYCRAAAVRDTKKVAARAQKARQDGDTALADACQLVIDFHERLRLPEADATEARQRELLALIQPAEGEPPQALIDAIGYAQSHEDEARVVEVNAIFAEQRLKDFAQGYALRRQAVDTLTRVEAALRAQSAEVETACPEAAGYLRQHADETAARARYLERQYQLCSDPEGMARRYAFYAKVAQAHQGLQAEIWSIIRDTYRGKTLFAIDLARAAGGDTTALDDLARRIADNDLAGLEPSMPEWYYLIEMELPFFHHYGAGKEFGGTTEIANELLRVHESGDDNPR
ncbi:MAG TPA: hypothetical protein PLD23_00160 [Armatimonadota bacterium]|nr:hypothetical protein [Armatimonadota bacterium]